LIELEVRKDTVEKPTKMSLYAGPLMPSDDQQTLAGLGDFILLSVSSRAEYTNKGAPC